MFNIVVTLLNYFTRELLRDYISAVKWHFILRKLVAAMFGGELFGGNIVDGQCCPWMDCNITKHVACEVQEKQNVRFD